MKVAFDTNVFLNKGNHIGRLRKILFTKPPVCRLALDVNGEIKREYADLAIGCSNEHILSQVYQFFAESEGPHVVTLNSEIDDDAELKQLIDNGCGRQIERSLFGMVRNDSRVYLELMPGRLDRGYNTDKSWDYVQERYLQNQESLEAELNRKLYLPCPNYPSNRAELEEVLREYSIGGIATEHEHLEFKEGPVDYLQFRDVIFDEEKFDKSLRARIAHSICGALNSCSGWVFVGIDKKGKIVGFPPVYVKTADDLLTKEPDQDEQVQQLISQDIREIKPNPLTVETDCISSWSIDIGDGRIVLAVLITKPKGDVRFTYKGVCYGKLGTTCPEITI